MKRIHFLFLAAGVVTLGACGPLDGPDAVLPPAALMADDPEAAATTLAYGQAHLALAGPPESWAATRPKLAARPVQIAAAAPHED
ncbi:hypothetical protein [Chitinimonas koreensis]|uniref:hypothetical protein n=1 Tax=Chitinimonas koreensis TaxID=356302 RepID=UPI0004080C7B|nr:hypothetical protein [Chitinimonas koreensis]QNM95666.1 hypothetical protein H9L41_17665 [Chitinimonas koreensis]